MTLLTNHTTRGAPCTVVWEWRGGGPPWWTVAMGAG